MIATLVTIQAVCVGVSTYLAFKTSTRTDKMKLVKKDKATGFKHYRSGRF